MLFKDLAPPKLTQIHTKAADPHICDKPAEAYYNTYQENIFWHPEFLFDSNHGDNKVNWAGDFTGTVTACYIIDEEGNPTSIKFPQSPGKELEDHIAKGISGWRFKPGNYTYEHHPVKVQVAVDITFQ